jgi:hypothetical protein
MKIAPEGLQAMELLRIRIAPAAETDRNGAAVGPSRGEHPESAVIPTVGMIEDPRQQLALACSDCSGNGCHRRSAPSSLLLVDVASLQQAADFLIVNELMNLVFTKNDV